MFGPFVPSSLFDSAPGEGVWFLFRRRELLLDAQLAPFVGVPAQDGLALERTQYLGELGGQPCFSAQLVEAATLPSGFRTFDLRHLIGRVRPELWALAGRALQVAEWDRTHRFCGACGTPTEPHVSSRARICSRCRLEHYPRVAPAMIVCVERGPEVLLARSPHFPQGIYSTLAGFVDPGESLEQAVLREVFEETHVRVHNLRYYASQPWPFPHSLMLGFWADYESGVIVPEAGEIEHADFFHVDALPPLFPGLFSVGNQLLADFCRRQGRAFPA